MRIGIVNQFAPPDESPTSVLAGELAEHLRSVGHDVELIACDGGYRNRRSVGGSRLLRELRAHLSLFWKCLRFRKADVLIAMSSPAILPATVSFAARLKRCRFSHWAMDVYPNVAVALGEIRKSGMIHRITSRLMRGAYQRAKPLVALTEEMREIIGEDAQICPPWAPTGLEWPSASRSPSTPFTWLYSGNLGRAHLFRPLLLAQKKLEDRGIDAHLIFQGSGPSLPVAKLRASELGLQNCEFRDYAQRGELLKTLFDANVLVATQNPDTAGMLWPSKLAVMNHVPRPILWVGDDLPLERVQRFSEDQTDEIAAWIEQQMRDPQQLPYSPTASPTESLRRWQNWLEEK